MGLAGRAGPERCSPETWERAGWRLLVPPVLVPHCAGPTWRGAAVGWHVRANNRG